MASYDTMTEALAGLKQRGYSHNFMLKSDRIEDVATGVTLAPEDFEIVEVYRFEGMSNPDDNSVVYAIESRNGLKGALVDAYGMYSDSLKTEIIEKLRITRREVRANGS